MRCEEAQPRLSDILDHRLSTENRQEIEAHMQGCEACHTIFLRLRAVSALVLAQKTILPKEASDAYFEDSATRLEKRLAAEFPDLQGASPFPAGDLFSSDLNSSPKLDSSEATGLSIPTALVRGLSHTRNESSNLFKLSDLQRIVNDAKPKSKPTPPAQEGSDLISKKSLQQLLGQIGHSPSGANLLARDASIQPNTPLIGVPFPADKPKRVWPVVAMLAGGALAIVAIVLLAISSTTNTPNEVPAPKPELAVNTPPANPTPNANPTPTPTPDPAATANPTPDTPPVTATPDPKKDPKVVEPKKTDPKVTATPKETTKTETPAVTPTPTPDKTATPTPTNSGKNKDELDDLLGGKKDSGTATASGPEQLSSSQISGVMSKANTSSCAAIGTGKVPMKVTINSSGSVTAATGDGTPLGNCVAGIVRRLKFPSISSPSQTFPYPIYIK